MDKSMAILKQFEYINEWLEKEYFKLTSLPVFASASDCNVCIHVLQFFSCSQDFFLLSMKGHWGEGKAYHLCIMKLICNIGSKINVTLKGVILSEKLQLTAALCDEIWPQ